MADIFISYAREDEATAIHLRDVLVEQGWDIWRDREGIVTGTSWEQSIEQALQAARCVIVVWSRNALASHFVRDEASVARNAGKLVPVQIENVEIPLGFRGIQTSNLVGWDGSIEHPEFRKLIRALEERVGAHTPRPPSDTILKRRRERSEHEARILERLRAEFQRRVPVALGVLARTRWFVPTLAALAILAIGFALGRLGAPGATESGHAALETGLKYFFDGKYVEAERDLETAAGKGSGLAAYYLARMYREGLGVKNDDVKAYDWAHRGAERGNGLAEYMTGLMLDGGRGTRRDPETALKWYLRAADQGLGAGALFAGGVYESGRGGGAPDAAKALDYYRRAVEDNNALAGNAIGDAYRLGRGVRQNVVTAVYWYKWAAEHGNSSAQVWLGYYYANGLGVQRDDVRAVEWYRRAAEQNNPAALNNLGYMYENGRVVALDLNEAAAYYRRAADLGDANAPANLGRVQEKLRSGRR